MGPQGGTADYLEGCADIPPPSEGEVLQQIHVGLWMSSEEH